MLDDAGDGVQSLGKRSCIRNAAKRCIEDQMSAVCNKRFAVRHPQCQGAVQAEFRGGAANRNLGRLQPEPVDFDRQREAAERFDQLGTVGNHDHAGRGRGDDLFAQQRAATTLDQCEFRIDLVGAVDGEVEFRHFVERGERHAELHAQGCGAFRRWHARDSHAGCNLLGQKPHELLRSRAGADAEPHAALDISKCRARGFDLQRSCIHAIDVRTLV